MKKLIDRWNSRKEDLKYLNKVSKAVNKLSKRDTALAQTTHDQVFEEMDCLQCANCCKSIPPMLSKRDTKRLAKHLSLTPNQFSEKYTTVDNDGDVVMNASPCPFLKADNKCQVYEVRPAACRLYPHSGEALFIKNMSHHKRNMKYCPGLFEIMDRLAKLK